MNSTRFLMRRGWMRIISARGSGIMVRLIMTRLITIFRGLNGPKAAICMQGLLREFGLVQGLETIPLLQLPNIRLNTFLDILTITEYLKDRMTRYIKFTA